MNGKQIESEVIRYLGDNNYRYAILIEGEWGCGKTYFVLNSLQTVIDGYEETHSKRKVRYISLYGCKSVEEIEENLYWSIVDEQFYKKYDQLTHSENYYGKEKEKRQKKTNNDGTDERNRCIFGSKEVGHYGMGRSNQ